MRSLFFLVLFLSVALHVARPQSGEHALKVGAAKVNITPKTLPNGYFHVRDSLYVRAIAIDNGAAQAALIMIDKGMISNDFYDRIAAQLEREFDLPAQNIMLSASHTHSSPWGESEIEESGTVEAVRKALSNLQPAQMSYQAGQSSINVNRDVIDPVTRLWSQGPNYDGPSDKTVAVINFSDMEGQPMAIYYNYAMHANMMFMSGSISADFPGATSDYLENFYGNDLIAVYSSGAAGDQNPVSVRPMAEVSQTKAQSLLDNGKAKDMGEAIMMAGFGGEADVEIDPKILERQSGMVSALGQLLGEEIIRLLGLPQKQVSTAGIYSVVRTITCPGRDRTNTGREGAPGTYKDGEDVEIKLNLLRIGDIAIAGVNAEVYTRIAERLKELSPLRYTIFSTITNGRANSGYIPSDESFQHHTFQVLGSRLKPNCAETAIIEGFTEMIATSD